VLEAPRCQIELPKSADLAAPLFIPDAVWERIPLAKRRLVILGPREAGLGAARDAAIILASELALRGVPQRDALAACVRIPFSPASTPERLVRKQFENFVQWAYKPPDGKPILTGCPASARVRSTGSGAGRLRGRFSAYCDSECERSCCILRGAREPEAVIASSPFSPVYSSTLWVPRSQAHLGPIAREVYRQLALLAAPRPSHPVHASSRYLSARTGFHYDAGHIRRLLKRMQQLELVSLIDRKHGIYRVHRRSAGWVERLETKLGTRRKVDGNRHAIAREQLYYLDWLNEWPDRETIVAGTGIAA
jgi:hypothetical protein